MKKIYHLANCTTCQRIIAELGDTSDFEFQNIKEQNVTTTQLDEMARFAGSFEALFSRRAMKYRSMGLHTKTLTEKDYRNLILEEYTFLKRPVIQLGDTFFIGNTKKVVAAARAALERSDKPY